jgi:hypothetical protein
MYKTRKAVDSKTKDADHDAVIQASQLRRVWERAHNYAKELTAAYRSSQRNLNKEIKESGIGVADWTKARIASKEHNLERFQVGIPAGNSRYCG